MANKDTEAKLSKTGPFSFSGFQDEVMIGTDLKNQSWLSHPEVLQAANVSSNNSMLALRDVVQGHRKTRPEPYRVNNSRDLEYDKFNNPDAAMAVEQGNSAGGPVGGWLGRPDPNYLYCRSRGRRNWDDSSLNWNQYFRIFNEEPLKVRVNCAYDAQPNQRLYLVVNGYLNGYNLNTPYVFVNTEDDRYLYDYEWRTFTPKLQYSWMVVSVQHWIRSGGTAPVGESATWGLEVRRA